MTREFINKFCQHCPDFNEGEQMCWQQFDEERINNSDVEDKCPRTLTLLRA